MRKTTTKSKTRAGVTRNPAATATRKKPLAQSPEAKVAPTPQALREGDLVYRVWPYIPPEGDDTWQLQERRVARATPLKIGLDRPFYSGTPLLPRGLLDRTHEGRLFHRTPTAAIAHFREGVVRDAKHHERRLAEARRALAWCDKQVGRLEPDPDPSVFVVIGARDSSDFDASTEDYVVCHHTRRGDADEHARRATKRARELQDLIGKASEEELRAGNELDPRWGFGNERPTQYRVEVAPRGRTALHEKGATSPGREP